MRTDTNERAEVLEIQGVASENLRGALAEMEAVASGTRATKPFYHASINTRADELLTDEQRIRAIDRLEKELGLTGQSRVVVLHQKEGREHCHIVWSRIDLDRMTAISDSHNYRKHEQVARDLEREFGHERVQGAHIERDGKERPGRTPSHDEMLAASRGATAPAEAKAVITDLWQRTDSGQSFKTALEDKGWILARGDRRDFVAIDPHGGTHSLGRRIDGAKAADVRERMNDVDAGALPSVSEARVQQRERQFERSTASLESAPEPPHVSPFREMASEIQARVATAEHAPSHPDNDRGGGKHQWEAAQRETFSPQAYPAREDDGGLKVIDGVTGAISSLGDFMLDFMSGSSSHGPTKSADMMAFVTDPQARKEQQLARLAETQARRESDKAVERMREDMQKGRSLRAEDIRALTREHQEQIKNFGDTAVNQLVDEARKRTKDEERERER